MELPGKRVLITGASRGIGESLAHAFAGAGKTVALVARTEAALQALAARLGGTPPWSTGSKTKRGRSTSW
jgi:short-subunit dehydrogenase